MPSTNKMNNLIGSETHMIETLLKMNTGSYRLAGCNAELEASSHFGRIRGPG